MEMGVGIHGEPGRRRVKLAPADDIAEEMLGAICEDLAAPARRRMPAAGQRLRRHAPWSSTSWRTRPDACWPGRGAHHLPPPRRQLRDVAGDGRLLAHGDGPRRRTFALLGCPGPHGRAALVRELVRPAAPIPETRQSIAACVPRHSRVRALVSMAETPWTALHERTDLPRRYQPVKFAIGQSVPRNEDPILVRGEGRLHGRREPARAALRRVRAQPLFARHPQGHRRLGRPGHEGRRRRLHRRRSRAGRLRHAEMRVQLLRQPGRLADDRSPRARRWRPARCASSAIPSPSSSRARPSRRATPPRPWCSTSTCCPPSTTGRRRAATGRAALYDEAPGNLVLDYHFGDADAVGAAFRSAAAHVTRLEIVNNRIVVNAMEPRAADRGLRRERPSATPCTRRARACSACATTSPTCMGVKPDKVRLLTGHVGGSFGMKGAVFPEYVGAAARGPDAEQAGEVDRQRSESFVSDHHGRDMTVDAELALDARAASWRRASPARQYGRLPHAVSGR